MSRSTRRTHVLYSWTGPTRCGTRVPSISPNAVYVETAAAAERCGVDCVRCMAAMMRRERPAADLVDDEDMLPCDYEDDRDARRPARGSSVKKFAGRIHAYPVNTQKPKGRPLNGR